MTTNKGKLILSALFGLGLFLASAFVVTGCSGSAPVSLSLQPTNTVLEATKTQQFTANVHNTSNKNVTWEFIGCSGAACGTISTDGLYTAPPVISDSATLSIKATSNADSTKSVSANLTLLPLSVTIPEDSVVLGAGEKHQFSASVMRHPNTAVTWSLSGCTASDCGSVNASGLYVGPSLVQDQSSVTVIARSQADPTKYDSVSVYNMPIEVSVTPSYTVIAPGSSLDFRANVTYDLQNEGVTWALDPGCTPETCGTLTSNSNTSVIYTAPGAVPDPSEVRLIAKSVSNNDKAVQVNIAISDSITSLKEGNYAFYFNGDVGYDGYEDSNAVWAAAAGCFHADGTGNITDGMLDMNLSSGVLTSVPFTGTYSVGPDYKGSFEISTAEGDFSYIMTVDPSGTGGKFISNDTSIAVSGNFELRDESAFSLSSIAGPYAVGISSGGREMAAVGRLDTDGTGTISNGRMDVSEYNYSDDRRWATLSVTQDISLTGFIGESDSNTGRGTASINLTPVPPGGAGIFNFAYYIVSDQKILLVQVDDRIPFEPVLSGEMRRQEGLFSTSSFDAPAIFSLSGVALWETGATIGRIVPDGAGSVTGLIDLFDYLEDDPFPPIRNMEFWGSYSIEYDGRSEIALEMGLDFDDYNRSLDPEAFFLRNSNQTYVAYFYGQNQGFLMQTSGNRGSYPSFGGFKPQAFGPFTAGSISETYLTNTMPGLSIACTERDSGLTTFDFAGNVTSSTDINNACSEMSQGGFNGQYTVDDNGRGTILFDGQADPGMVFWIISPSELVAVSNTRVLIGYRR